MRSSLALAFLTATLAGCGGGSNNAPPSLLDDQARTSEDEPVVIDVLANDSDVDGDALEILAATTDSGAVEIVDGGIRVTPDADFFGAILVDVEVSDGDAIEWSETVVTVDPVNDVPSATAASVITGRNAQVAIALTGADVDDDTLTFELAVGPAHGTLEGTIPDLVFVPATDYVGPDELIFIVRDAHDAASEPATVAIEVTAGAMPVAEDVEAETAEDGAVEVALTASDADGDALTFVVATPPAHGTLGGAGATLTYTPDDDYHGPDAFTYTAFDGVLTSAPALASISVTPVNDAPVAIGTIATTSEDTGVSIALTGTDVDGDTLSFAIADAPARGAVAITDASALYVPTADRHGADSFTFTVSDGSAISATATVSIVVAAVPDAPVAQAQNANAIEDQPLAITLVASDGDGDALTYTVATAPSHGTLTGTAPALVYTPTANYHGPDSLVFVASDGAEASAPASVSIAVASINDPPTAANNTVTLLEDHTASLTLAGLDVDGDALTFSIVAPPAKGALTGTGASRTYAPRRNTNGNDPFTYQVSDGQSATTAIVTLAVTPVNDPPVAQDDAAIATAGQTVTIPVSNNDADADGDPLTVTMVEFWGSSHGTATFSGGDIFYTPLPGFTGTERFRYSIRDPFGAGTTAWIYAGVGQFPHFFPDEFIGQTSNANQTTTQVLHDVSDDGRYVAFVSPESLVGEDLNGVADVYVHDRLNDGLELVSISSYGELGNGPCGAPSLSGDGWRVAFSCTASDLDIGDTNGVADVFVHDRVAGTTIRVSVGAGGAQGTGASERPTISANGRVVAFTSAASNLVEGDGNGTTDVFVRDLEAQTTVRVSVSSAGVEGDDVSDEVALTADGRVVAFRSKSTNLVSGDDNGKTDVFVRDVVAGTTARVSLTATGGEANDHSRLPWLSEDGRHVSFISQATNLTTDATYAGSKGFVRDRDGATTTWLAIAYEHTVTSLRLSADGHYATGSAGGIVFVINRINGDNEYIGLNWGPVFLPVVSRNGAYVAFLSHGPFAPLPPGTPSGTNLFVIANPVL